MRSAVLLTAALPAALAVSLLDFSPRASSLPPNCQSVYTATIDTCQPADFQDQQCSDQCVDALNALRSSIAKACQGVTGHNILVAFMSGQGTQDLCPNVASVGGGSSNPPPPPVGPAPAHPGSANPPSPPPQPSAPDNHTTDQRPPPPPSTGPSGDGSKSPTTGGTTAGVITNTVMPAPSDTNMGTSIVADNQPPAGVAPKTMPASGNSPAPTSVTDSGSPFDSGTGSPFDAGMGGTKSDAGVTRPAMWTACAMLVVGGLMVTL